MRDRSEKIWDSIYILIWNEEFIIKLIFTYNFFHNLHTENIECNYNLIRL